VDQSDYAVGVTRGVAEIGVCLLDADGRTIDVDPGFSMLTGLDLEPGQVLREAITWCPSLPRAKAECLVRHRDVELTLRATGVRSGLVAYTVLARRVPAASEIARELQNAQQVFQALLDASPVAIVILDADTRVTIWNRAAVEIFKWTAEEVVGQRYPLVPEEQWESFADLFREVMDGRGFTGVLGVRRRKDGSPISLRMHTAPMRDAEGVIYGGMAILEDLTETHRLEERVLHAQKMEAIGRLAGGIAHDFNNLLTVVVGMADLLGLDPSMSAESIERIEEIQRVSESARELVGQLMTFSRLQVVRPQVIDVDARVRDSRRMLERLLPSDVCLRIEASETPMWVRADPTHFDRILVNLTVNARDAMRGGGELSFRSGVVAVASVPGEESSAHTRYVCLTVADTGEGIPADVLPHIFDPFFTTKGAGEGTGLGLANVYGVVRQSGGMVEADSTVGKGTEFRIYLPQVSAPVESGRRVGPGSRIPSGDERILLVEDNDAVRKSTARLLASLGYTVDTANDGMEALARFGAGLAVDMVLTDLSMPLLGGAELAERLSESYPDLPIVFMSGKLDVTSLRREVEAGRATFLQKPVSIQTLATTTRAVLDQRA